MARQRVRGETKVSFQVTFTLPHGMTIPQARVIIEEQLVGSELKIASGVDIKIHLTNKEIKYNAQR